MVKAFTYLSGRLPRSEFLEPYLDEATVEPIETTKKQMMLFQKAQEKHMSESMEGIDISAAMAGIQLATGKPPGAGAADRGADVPLSEAEPDMFPCLLALVGSGCGFMKVRVEQEDLHLDSTVIC